MPVTGPVKRLTTQTGTPPDEIGSGGPRKHSQVSGLLHDDGASGSQVASELPSAAATLKQTQFLDGPGNAAGPFS